MSGTHSAPIVVMGVSGCGKSTVAKILGRMLGAEFIDADDRHSEGNKAKMARGVPLDDIDRAPWLEVLGRTLQERPNTVLACSALKRRYRDDLRRFAPDAYFVHLNGTVESIASRLHLRHHEFMPSNLLESQFSALEPLELDEFGTVLDVQDPPDAIARAALDALSTRSREATPAKRWENSTAASI